MTSTIGSTILGYPRIGPDRELKRALESYWAGKTDEAALRNTGRTLRANTWQRLSEAGLESVPSNTFSFYDHVLDTAVTFGAVPTRYAELGLSTLDTYFAMARGTGDVAPLEMTKWFDTNYHYLVPEIGPDTTFTLSDRTPVTEFTEARELGVTTRPVLVGPVTFLLLAKSATAEAGDFRPLDRLDALLESYRALLAELHAAGAEWVQLDEPALAADRTEEELAAVARAYDTLAADSARPRTLVTGYYGDMGPALTRLANTSVEALGVDLVAGASTAGELSGVPALRHKTVVAGVVDGRNVWRTDLESALARCATLLGLAADVAVSTSCSLLHVPHDVEAETSLDPRLRSWLAFADQKVEEVVALHRALHDGRGAAEQALHKSRDIAADRITGDFRDDSVRSRLAALRDEDARRPAFQQRVAAQRETLDLPPLPTTTIGSFPQTSQVRKARAALRNGEIDDVEYRTRMRSEIEQVIRLQEDIGLDVLVHGEPERGDMVQYFADYLTGVLSTEYGWVQSYGSRCVRPPIIYGDVARREPMSVEWSRYAQSLTDRPVKGMLTGPVTILAWSFVRDDQPMARTAEQVALAMRDEVVDLESAGIRAVQVDEPALRELLPLRRAEQQVYLDWAVHAFRLATAGVADGTQIHTHLCYSEFGEVIDAIIALDADVTSIEAARSRMEVLGDLSRAGFSHGVGPGVYDIHSPRVPAEEEIVDLLDAALESVPTDRLWVNPDCGLKTRGYPEIEPALRRLVAAARRVRADLR